MAWRPGSGRANGGALRGSRRRRHAASRHARTDEFYAAYGDEGSITPTRTIEEFVAAIARPRPILIMVKAGSPVDEAIDALGQWHRGPDDTVLRRVRSGDRAQGPAASPLRWPV